MKIKLSLMVLLAVASVALAAGCSKPSDDATAAPATTSPAAAPATAPAAGGATVTPDQAPPPVMGKPPK